MKEKVMTLKEIFEGTVLNPKLNFVGFEKYLYDYRLHPDVNGVQYIFRFENGYGASVIKSDFSYGHEHDLWELAVMQLCDDNRMHLCYDTPITDDVLGSLSDEDVRNLLDKIKKL